MHENVIGVAAQRGQRVQIAGVGEFVQIDDAIGARRIFAIGKQAKHEIGADKAGAAGDEYGFHYTVAPKSAQCYQ